MRHGLSEWMWQHAIGTSDGELHPLPRGAVPPKAAICTILVNPVYKFILVKNTKVAGTSVFLSLGGFCKAGISLEEAKVSAALCDSPLLHILKTNCSGIQLHVSATNGQFIPLRTKTEAFTSLRHNNNCACRVDTHQHGSSRQLEGCALR